MRFAWTTGRSWWPCGCGACVSAAALIPLILSRVRHNALWLKPWQNGFAESFHSRLRDEFLDGEVFLSVLDAQVRLGIWRRYWNEGRLHSSLGYVTPNEFAARWAAEARNGAETKAAVGA